MKGSVVEVSVIVIAYNEEKRILNCLESLLNQATDLSYEVILVDDGSTDRTAAVAAGIASNSNLLKIIQLGTNLGRGAARQTGIDFASGNLIGFVDADIVVPRDWLERCSAGIGDYAAVSGIAVPDGDVAVLYRIFRANPRPKRGSMPITGNNVLFNGSVLRSIGVEKESRLGEDFRLAARLLQRGYRLRTISELEVEHLESKTYKQGITWLYESGKDATKLLVQFRHFRVPDLVWILWASTMVSSLLLAFLEKPLFILIPFAASILIGVSHALSRFGRRAGIARLALTSIADVPMTTAYLIGRTVGLRAALKELDHC